MGSVHSPYHVICKIISLSNQLSSQTPMLNGIITTPVPPPVITSVNHMNSRQTPFPLPAPRTDENGCLRPHFCNILALTSCGFSPFYPLGHGCLVHPCGFLERLGLGQTAGISSGLCRTSPP